MFALAGRWNRFAGKFLEGQILHRQNVTTLRIDADRSPRQLTEKVKAEPASASRLVQGWMQEGQS